MRSIRLGLGSSLAVALFAAMAAACGGDEGGGNAKFIGEWQYTSGTSNLQCQLLGINETSQLTGDKFRISKGIDSPLVYSEADTNCVWKMTVNGSVASVASSQTCMFTDEGVTFTGSYTAGTFTVTGTTATFAGSATLSANVNGSVVNCTATANGGLTKVSN